MAFKLKEYVNAINESRLAVEEGRLVVVDKKGNRQEYSLDTEVKDFSYGAPFIEFQEKGKRVRIKCTEVKALNGVSVERYK